MLCKADQLNTVDFPFLAAPLNFDDETFEPRPWEEAVIELKRHYLSKVLQHTGGVKGKAAELLQIQQSYLSRLLKSLQLDD